MRIITRAEWGAAPAKHRTYIATPTPRLWLHHTAGALDAGGNGVWWDDVRGIQDFHMRPTSKGGRGWSDIAYSFLVGGGQIFEGRGVGIAGGHTAGDNSQSHAICLIGDYTWMTPKQADLEAIAWLMRHGRERGWWGDLTGPHRDAPGAATQCCGRNLIDKIPDLRRMAATTRTTTQQEAPMVSDWAQKAWHWAVKVRKGGKGSDGKHLLNGSRPQDPVTREELAVILHRYDTGK